MEEKIFMVRVAEQAERFEDMYNFLKEVVASKDADFTTEERNLLSVGFKNLIGSNRTAIRTIGAIEQNPKYQKYSASLLAYRQKIEAELFTQCISIVTLVKEKCMKLATNGESKAFFLKMAGDYYRYVAESAQGDKLTEVKNGALDYYNQASEIANKDLNACNPIRLGLALNFSVFHYEVMNDHKKACQLGEVALQSALDKIDECDEDTFRDAKSIIELLKENLSLWKEDEGQDGNEIEDL
jgi:14-3-3 protein epsilon